MGVTLGIAGKNDATGWTVFTESASGSGEGSDYVGAGTRKIYVSTSGNDSNTGTQASPKQTLVGGSALLRGGSPDWLLLKRGDKWTDESFGPDNNGFLNRSGQDADNPMIIGAYGTGARPIIEVDRSKSIICFNSGNSASHLVYLSLDCRCYERDPDDVRYAGIINSQPFGFVLTPFARMIIEDCRFAFFLGIELNCIDNPSGNHFVLRRNAFDRLWAGINYGGTGILAGHVENITIEDCIWYQCAVAPNDDVIGWSLDDGFSNSHNLYINYDCGIVNFKNSISYLTQYHCLKARSGANITNSFLGKGSQGFEVYNMGASAAPPGGVPTTTLNILDNVFMNMRDQDRTSIPHGGGGGSTGELANMNDSTPCGPIMFKRNICHHSIANSVSANVSLSRGAIGCEVIDNIIYSMAQGISISDTNPTYPSFGTNVVTPNQVDLNGDNAEYSFPDPNNATLTAYATSIGLSASEDVLMRAICNNRNGAWDYRLTAPAINDFMRTKFGMATLGVDGSGGSAVPISRPRLRLR
jgi:hypothetical protein